MPEKVRIPLAVAEITAQFRTPRIDLIGSAMSVTVERIAEAWVPFGFRLPNLEILSTGAPADHGVSFKLPSEGIQFQFGAEKYIYRKEQASLVGAEKDLEPLLAAERVLLAGRHENVGSCVARVAMHLQAESCTPHQLLAPLFPAPLKKLLENRPASSFGHHLVWDQGDLLVDFSVPFANAVFVRFTTNFDGKPEIAVMLSQVRRKHAAILEALGVEEVGND